MTAAAEAAAAKEAAGKGTALSGLKLEDPSVLQEPGSHPGQTRVVREGGTGVAYSWNETRYGAKVMCPGHGARGWGREAPWT